MKTLVKIVCDVLTALIVAVIVLGAVALVKFLICYLVGIA